MIHPHRLPSRTGPPRSSIPTFTLLNSDCVDSIAAHATIAHARKMGGLCWLVAKAVREWLSRLGVETLFIEPGSPWENGYIESLNGKLRDELLNGEIFTTLKEAKVLTELWRRDYNQVRPHSSLGYKPPAPEAAPGLLIATTS